MALTPVGDLGIALKSDVDDFHKGMATSRESIGLLTSSVQQASAALRNMGIVVTGTAAIAGAAMLGLSRKAERVNEAFREVGTISSEVSDVQEEYGSLISELNTEFGLQAGKLEIIEGLYQSVSAGVSEGAESQREFLTTAARLAVVGGTDLATTVDVLSTSINAYGKGTEFAGRASEALFRTVQFGKIRLEELAPVMGRVMALAGGMGIEIEELGSSMAVLTRIGFEARVAATGLRNVIRAMMRPSEKMQSMLREVALSQDLYADSMDKGADTARRIAREYRNVTDALAKLNRKQDEAREKQEEASLAIQEARLKIQAIEQGRLDQLPDLVSEKVKEADTVEELNSVIEDYRFKVKKARVQEEKFRQQADDQKESIADLRSEFKEKLDVEGDLEKGIGRLVVNNENLVGTLEALRERADETGTSFSEIFPRTRALQAALALVGEDASLLRDIFNKMREEGVEEGMKALEKNKDKLDMTKEEFQNLKESMRSVPEIYEDQVGPAQEMRNATSELSESMSVLGRVFNEEVTDAITTFADLVSGVVDGVKTLDESTKDNLARFAVLATVLGLVIGPLMILGGQMALIASSLGIALIPFLGIVIGLFGSFAMALNTALEGGDEAKSMFSGMVQVLKDVHSFLMLMGSVFMNDIAPGIIRVAQGFGDVIGAAASGFNKFFGETASTKEIIQTLGETIGNLLIQFGKWLTSIAPIVESLVILGLDILFGVVIPAIQDLIGWGQELFDVAMDIAEGIMEWVSSSQEVENTGLALISFAQNFIDVVEDVINKVIKFVDKNQDSIRGFVEFAFTIASIVIPVATKFITLLGVLIDDALTIANFFLNLLGPAFDFLGGIIVFVIKKLASYINTIMDFLIHSETLRGILWIIIGLVAGVAGAFILAGSTIASIIGTIITFMKVGGILVGVVETIILIIKGVIKFFILLGAAAVTLGSILIKEILKWGGYFLALGGAIEDIVWDIVGYFSGLPDWIWNVLSNKLPNIIDGILAEMEGWLNWIYEKAKDIPGMIADGIKDAAWKVGDAMAGVGRRIASYLPASPPEKGPLSKNTPEDAGKKITSQIATGIESEKGSIDSSMKSLTDGQMEDLKDRFKGDGEEFSFGNPEDMEFDMGDKRKKMEDQFKFDTEGKGSGKNLEKDALGKDMGTTVTIESQAIYFAEGSFQGILPREIPPMVREEVEKGLDDIVERLSGKGVEIERR